MYSPLNIYSGTLLPKRAVPLGKCITDRICIELNPPAAGPFLKKNTNYSKLESQLMRVLTLYVEYSFVYCIPTHLKTIRVHFWVRKRWNISRSKIVFLILSFN